MEQKKRCSRCKEEKPLSDFHFCKGQKYGRYPKCKPCVKIVNKEEYPKRRQKAVEYQRRYRDLHPEKCRQRVREYQSKNVDRILHNRLKKAYGIGLEHYQQMELEQEGRCKICGDSENGGRKLSVDHDHETGAVRSLLCVKCNTTLGLVGDSQDRLEAMIAYLRSHREIDVKTA